MTFSDELRILLRQHYSKKKTDEVVSTIKLLISKYAPEEKYFTCCVDRLCPEDNFNSRWNSYRAELFREMGIK